MDQSHEKEDQESEMDDIFKIEIDFYQQYESKNLLLIPTGTYYSTRWQCASFLFIF